MPKVFGRELPAVVIAGGGVLAIVLLYTALVPGEQPAVKSTIKKAKKSSTVSKTGVFTEQDFSIRLAAVAEPMKNSFKPLVARQQSGGPGRPGALPGKFTGDGGTWVYTGMAVVNGVSQALLENRSSGDAEFVQKGERWKNSTIIAIDEDSVSLSGPDGEVFTMIVDEGGELPAQAGVTAPGGIAPVTVPSNLVGEIGVQPMGQREDEGSRRRTRRNRDGQNNQEE